MNKLLLLAPMVAILPAFASAGEEEAPVTVMDEVVVTATKTEETRKEIVNSVVIKDSSALEETPASSLGAIPMMRSSP
jgi:outer membrane cobalamin receptor